MSAATLGECIDLTIRFSPMITTAYDLRLNRAEGIAGLVVDVTSELRDVEEVIVLGVLIGMRMVG
jgi:hypothetical protein